MGKSLLGVQGTSKSGQESVAQCIAVLSISAGPKQISSTVSALLKNLQVPQPTSPGLGITRNKPVRNGTRMKRLQYCLGVISPCIQVKWCTITSAEETVVNCFENKLIIK